MTNYLYYNYYYRYRELRKQIKTIVDNQSYIEAKTKLETAIAEHQSKFPDSDTRLDFNYGEKIIMNHALAHINTVINNNDPSFINSNDGTIGQHSDIVKSALVYTPKSDYRDND